MPKTLDQKLKELAPERRAAIEANAAKMAAEILSLREVRQAMEMTQQTIAQALNMEQENVSRLERRADLLLSTLRNYVAAMGGELKLIAEFPHRPPIQIETLAHLSEKTPAKRKWPTKHLHSA